jgi:hypothetical protein
MLASLKARSISIHKSINYFNYIKNVNNYTNKSDLKVSLRMLKNVAFNPAVLINLHTKTAMKLDQNMTNLRQQWYTSCYHSNKDILQYRNSSQACTTSPFSSSQARTLQCIPNTSDSIYNHCKP